MRKRLTVFLLLFMSLWQAASAAGLSGAWLDQGVPLEHTVMHWQGEAHHHGDHGAIQADESQDSIQHMMADCGFHHVGVIEAPAIVTFDPLPQHVAQAAQAVPPPPHLDGLRRPPRPLS